MLIRECVIELLKSEKNEHKRRYLKWLYFPILYDREVTNEDRTQEHNTGRE